MTDNVYDGNAVIAHLLANDPDQYVELLRQLARTGTRLPGACPDCDAYSEVEEHSDRLEIKVFHDESCIHLRDTHQ